MSIGKKKFTHIAGDPFLNTEDTEITETRRGRGARAANTEENIKCISFSVLLRVLCASVFKSIKFMTGSDARKLVSQTYRRSLTPFFARFLLLFTPAAATSIRMNPKTYPGGGNGFAPIAIRGTRLSIPRTPPAVCHPERASFVIRPPSFPSLHGSFCPAQSMHALIS
jgi:hypothetical protein